MADEAEVARSIEVDGGIVVGTDGSEASMAGVAWAAGLAAHTGQTLHVVRAWVIADAPRPSTWEFGYAPPLSDYETAVLDDLRAAVDAAGFAESVDVQLHAVHGAPGRALVEASVHADHVVVGQRGRGGFRGLLLGSTSDQVVRHAECPVTVVRTRSA